MVRHDSVESVPVTASTLEQPNVIYRLVETIEVQELPDIGQGASNGEIDFPQIRRPEQDGSLTGRWSL